MLDPIFIALSALENFYWSYIGFSAVMAVGLYFTFKAKFYQLKVLARPLYTLRKVQEAAQGGEGINPIRLYFASVGGMIGLGNIVGVVTAVMLGGPGALFWLWIAAILGMLIKYAEVYLGIKYRQPDGKGGFNGGPMVYLKEAFETQWISKLLPLLFCGFLAFYGVEVYQFVVVVDTIADTWDLNRTAVLGVYLALTLYGGFGGMQRLSAICTWVMPFFIVGYILLSLYIIGTHWAALPEVIGYVCHAAFNGHSVVGAFAGCTVMAAMQFGTSRAVYSGDLGIGYDSIIQSESGASKPEAQASLSIFGVLTNAVICTMSILVVLVTGVWNTEVPAHLAVTTAFSYYLPYMDVYMALLFVIAGYTTVIAYLAVGEKAVRWIFPKYGYPFYVVYAALSFVLFSFMDQERVLVVMMVSGGFLMLSNLIGIWKLRHEVEFKAL